MLLDAKGIAPQATLGEFARRWQEKYGCLRKPSTFKAQTSHLRVHIIPTLGMLRLNEITLEEQQRFVVRLAKTVRRKTLLNVLPLPDALAQHLKNYIRTWRPNPEELLFTTRLGTPMDASKLTQRRLQPLLKRLGIRRAGLHAFRHTCASPLVEQGISMRIAQQQLGHSDPRITLAIYRNVLGDSHRQAGERLFSVLDFWWPQLATSDDKQKVKGQLIQ